MDFGDLWKQGKVLVTSPRVENKGASSHHIPVVPASSQHPHTFLWHTSVSAAPWTNQKAPSGVGPLYSVSTPSDGLQEPLLTSQKDPLLPLRPLGQGNPQQTIS